MARIEVYTTPMCPYCVAAKRLLTERGIAYDEIDVAEDAALRAEIVQRSGRRTVPQIFIGEQSIGGFDELYELDQSGELDTLLKS